MKKVNFFYVAAVVFVLVIPVLFMFQNTMGETKGYYPSGYPVYKDVRDGNCEYV